MPTTRSSTQQQSIPTADSNAVGNNVLQSNSNLVFKIPRFWKENPILWFAQIEAQFTLHNISNEKTKYFIILADLDPEILSQVSDIVSNPPNDAYALVKQRLIEHFSISEENRIKTLLTTLEIGDKKPSTLLREMRNLANGYVTEDFLRTMWLQRLPSQSQAILATSSESLDNLSKMADKIGDIQAPRTGVVSEIHSVSELSEIKAQIQSINNVLRGLQISRRSRSRTPNSRLRKNSSGDNICYYHRKFKNKARKCRSPCSFNKNSENLKPGR